MLPAVVSPLTRQSRGEAPHDVGGTLESPPRLTYLDGSPGSHRGTTREPTRPAIRLYKDPHVFDVGQHLQLPRCHRPLTRDSSDERLRYSIFGGREVIATDRQRTKKRGAESSHPGPRLSSQGSPRSTSEQSNIDEAVQSGKLKSAKASVACSTALPRISHNATVKIDRQELTQHASQIVEQLERRTERLATQLELPIALSTSAKSPNKAATVPAPTPATDTTDPLVPQDTTTDSTRTRPEGNNSLQAGNVTETHSSRQAVNLSLQQSAVSSTTGDDRDANIVEHDHQSSTSKRPKLSRLPCVFGQLQGRCPTKHRGNVYPFTSNLDRPHGWHRFFYCHFCMILLPSRSRRSAHKDLKHIKACAEPYCKRQRLESEIPPTSCNCMKSAEEQWYSLFNLKWPKKDIPRMFPEVPVPQWLIEQVHRSRQTSNPDIAMRSISTSWLPLQAQADSVSEVDSGNTQPDHRTEPQLAAIAGNQDPLGDPSPPLNEYNLDDWLIGYDNVDLALPLGTAQPQQQQGQQEPLQTPQGPQSDEVLRAVGRLEGKVAALECLTMSASEREEELIRMVRTLLEALEKSGSEEYHRLERIISPRL